MLIWCKWCFHRKGRDKQLFPFTYVWKVSLNSLGVCKKSVSAITTTCQTFHCLDPAHWGGSQGDKPGSRERTQAARYPISADGCTLHDSQPDPHGQMPFMDHWNVSRPHVSLRDIIKEEQALQENVEKVTHTLGVPTDKIVSWFVLYPSLFPTS